ncbi:hypothetical protein B8W87_02780 [Rothia dentocariosa]|jgi:putative membrane protein|uniref:Uncharacterized protein n=1 Tax=Rothia dentocariosa TaxID=2047 RepID=A0AAE5KQ94_9MICC|nr:hypothetical protein B8W87_02780 [Rothia dentocariosa]
MFTQLRMLLLSVPGIAFLLTSYRDLQDDPERGDVPGWVMITMMSAILVAAILAIAQPALIKMFNDAIALIRP